MLLNDAGAGFELARSACFLAADGRNWRLRWLAPYSLTLVRLIRAWWMFVVEVVADVDNCARLCSLKLQKRVSAPNRYN